MRRSGLAALTDSWLRQVFADAAADARRRPGAGRAGRGRRLRPRRAGAGQRPRPVLLHADREHGRRPGREDLVPGLGHRRAPRPRGAHLRGGPPAGQHRPRRPARAARRPAGRRRRRRWSAGCAPASSATGARRPAAGCPSCGRRGTSAAPAPATCGTTSSPTSRRAAAGCATSCRCAPSPPPGSPTGRTATSTTPYAGWPTSATPCTWSPAGPATGCCCRSRTSVAARPRPGRRRRAAARGRCSSAAAVTHAADVTWRRALQATRPQRSRFVRGRRPVLRLLGPGLAEHDGEAVLTAQADPRVRPAARAADGRPRGPRRAAALAELGRPARRPTARRCREPWPENARHLFVELLGAGAAAGAGLGGPRPGRAARPAAAGVGPGAAPPAAQRGAPLQRRPAPARDARCRRRRWCATCTARTCCSSAALLHDIGKGSPRRPQRGGRAARRRGRARGWASTPTTSQPSGLLVRHHLLLVETATRRDLDDPATVAAVADALGDRRGARAAGGPDPWPTRWPPARPPGASGRRASWTTSYAGPRCGLHGAPPPPPPPLTADAGRAGRTPAGWPSSPSRTRR